MTNRYPLIFIGFMGAGKSFIGEHFAKQHHLSFIDLDNYISWREDRSIPKIFQEEGESVFRELELRYLKEVANHYQVIATGGGIVETEASREYLNALNQRIIWLDAPFDTLYERVKDDPNRPNAKDKDYDTVKRLYLGRISRYNEIAFIRLDTNQQLSQLLNELNKIIFANEQY